MYGHATTQTRLQSETADGISWARYATPSAVEHNYTHPIRDALLRATFEELASPTPLHAALQRVRLQQEQQEQHSSVIVVLGRSRRLAVEDHHAEIRALENEYGASVRADVRKTVGDVGTAFVMAGVDANLLVMQASGNGNGTHSD
jgi:K+:H+ antiporter